MAKKNRDNLEKDKEKTTSYGKKKRIPLIEILIVIVILAVIANFLFQLLNLGEFFSATKQLGFWGSVAAVAAGVAIGLLIKKIFK